MNFNNFAKEGWGWFEHFFWVGACCQRGGRFSKGGGGGVRDFIESKYDF